MVCEIPISPNKVTLVDDEDAAAVLRLKWQASTNNHRVWYARRPFWSGGRRRTVLLHRWLLDAPAGALVDHINGDGLDNRRANLRLCNHSQNAANALWVTRGKSGYRGVFYDASKRRWQAEIKVRGVVHRLGRYRDPVLAALAYDAAAAEHFGEFATLTFLNAASPVPSLADGAKTSGVGDDR